MPSEGGIPLPPPLSETAPAAFSLPSSTPPVAVDEDLLTEDDTATAVATVVVLLLFGVFTFLVLRNCGRISTLS